MNILFVGGSGIISHACASEALARGHDVWTLTRGSSHRDPPVGSRRLVGDAENEDEVRALIRGLDFDAVVQWTAFRPDQVRRDIELFADAGQYVFVSSASVYQKPPSHWLITETTPRGNPYWGYARDKIACEDVLFAAHESTGFRVTVIRPSLTYGDTQIPVAIGSWLRPFTLIERMRRGAKILVPGDGTSIWTLTHNSDLARGLVPLLGQAGAVGEAFHITSDEALTWNQIYGLVAAAAGVHADVLHVPSDALVAADPDLEGTLWGDKSNSAVFDNAKLRRFVPDFRARVPFAEGIARTVQWFDADPRRQEIDDQANALWDHVARVYLDALARVARRPRT